MRHFHLMCVLLYCMVLFSGTCMAQPAALVLRTQDGLEFEIPESDRDERRAAAQKRAHFPVEGASEHCAIYENEVAHSLLDNICDMCHNLFQAQEPNLRMKCRSNCFSNDVMSKCNQIVAGSASSPVRRSASRRNKYFVYS